MRRLLAPLACIAFLSACSSPDKGFGETTTVERGDLGATWPLTVDSALLTCNKGVVAVQVDGRATVIDQDTTTRDVSHAFVEIWAHDGSQPNGLTDLTPLMKHGQTLCN